MKKQLPTGVVIQGHPDFETLRFLQEQILTFSQGLTALSSFFPEMLRDEIDKLIDTPNTDRRSYKDLEKVEKTYMGTRVEIRLRKHWGFPKGRLDLMVGHMDVDIKHTMESGWMIPTEAIGEPCVLSAADESSALCYLGLIVARPEYLSGGTNKDGKASIQASAWKNIVWLIKAAAYPRNFWQTLDLETVGSIFAGSGGTDRLCRLLRAVLDRVLPRKVICDTAQQLDPMKRLRRNGGARDQLAQEGIIVMTGDHHRAAILEFGLPYCAKGEVIAHKISSPAETDLALRHGLLP